MRIYIYKLVFWVLLLIGLPLIYVRTLFFRF